MESATIILRTDMQKFRAIELLKNYQPDPDHPMQVEFSQWEPQKSISQRNYWHKLLREMAAEGGYDPDDMKNIVKEKLLGLHWLTLPDGREVGVIPSSEAEKKYGYSKLIDGTIRLASDWFKMKIVDTRR